MSELNFKQLTHTEQRLALPLLGKCFPAYWEQRALTLQEFPFHEISFAAFDGTRIVGHCGVIPYDVARQDGDCLHFGGIASVAVDPDYRKQGIARNLCMMTIPWAKEQGMDSLTLYTEFFHVYQSAGWTLYDVPQTTSLAFPEKSSHKAVKRSVTTLSDTQRHAVRDIYLASETFTGKITRGDAHEFNGWKRLLNDPDFHIALTDDAYALFCDGVLVELAHSPSLSDASLLDFALSCTDENGMLDVLLPDSTRAWKCLAEASVARHPSPVDVMHGERPMFLDLSLSAPHAQPQRVFYPIPDKF